MAGPLAGIPPSGLGYYARDRIDAPFGPPRFVAVDFRRTDAASMVRTAHSRGAETWLYATPEAWTPDAWRGTLPGILALAGGLGCAGIIADPEGGWSRDAADLGRALADAAGRTRVGLTSFPSWPGLASCVGAAGTAIWGSPQIYGRESQDGAAFAAWYRRWTDLMGARVVPSIAGWTSNPAMQTAEGFRTYLSRLPHAGGAIVWRGAGAMPQHIAEGLAGYEPGGSAIGTAVLAAGSAITPRTVAIAALVLAVAAGAVFLYMRR